MVPPPSRHKQADGKPSIPVLPLPGMEPIGSLVCVLEDKAFLATQMVIITTIISRQQDARSFGASYLSNPYKNTFPPGRYIPILQKSLRYMPGLCGP